MKVLVLKTSADKTIQKLFKEFDESMHKDVDCLIQSSQIETYRKAYPHMNFIDIHRERFEDIPSEVMNIILKKTYDRVYITLTGENARRFWNVIELISRVHFKKAFFYNCNGEKIKIPRKNIVKDTICRLYIKWVSLLY